VSACQVRNKRRIASMTAGLAKLDNVSVAVVDRDANPNRSAMRA